MSLTLIGKKKTMLQVFDKNGCIVVATAICIEPNVVVQIKTKNKDGYNAVQLAAEKSKNMTKPLKGHFAKSSIDPKRYLKESRVEKVEEFQIGQQIDVGYFSEGNFVDVQGMSKGKGYQGVMKLHGFRGGPASHGASLFHRHAGSTGMRSTPGRCLPGGKRASRMGGDTTTVQSLQVLYIDTQNNLLIVKGAIPGSQESQIFVTLANKKKNQNLKKQEQK